MKNFNAKKETEKIVDFIKSYTLKNNIKGAVLGISGGKDSGVVAGLLVKALGKENVVGLTLPCHSKSKDATLAKTVADKFGFKLYNCDLTEPYNKFVDSINYEGKESKEEYLVNSKINLKPRLRMAAVYYYAAMLSAINGATYIVAGTSNKCELYVGYFTKGGDSVNDIAPIAHLTVDEVIAVGDCLGVPKEVLYRTPSDGLSGVTDEEKLGVKYSDIAAYIDNPKNVDVKTRKKIKILHKNCRHKFVNNCIKK